MGFLGFELHKLVQAAHLLISPGAIFGLPQLAVALAIATLCLAWRQQRRRGRVRWRVILRAMRSRRIVVNRSTGADLLYYVINTFAISTLIGWGLLSAAGVSTAVVHLMRAAFGTAALAQAPQWTLRVAITLAVFLGYELGYYIDHRLKHSIPLLWEFHKTHHTAEVLTPLTVFRVHPVDTLLFVNITAGVVGLAHGALTWAVGKSVDIYAIDGANIITIVFLFALAQLQHSEFWIPLRGIGGRILLSPAHHQIHHSMDPAHYNRNMGSFLAIWDWMFGTLCIPQSAPPRLKFGVSDAGQDPHRLETLLIAPVQNACRVVSVSSRRRDASFLRVGT